MKKDIFIERNLYSDIILKRIRDLKDGYRQNIAVIGDELIGKTSIIFNLLNKFYDSRYIITYLESRPESLNSFAKRFIGVLLYNFLLNSGEKLEEKLDFLLKKSHKYIPKTAQKISSILHSLEKRKKNNIFTELLGLCEMIHQETGKFCVVIFDEFHNLENIGIKDIYAEWAKLLLLQKNTMYIVISSLKFKTKAILSKELSLLFGNFEILTIEPFDINTCEYYLEQKLGMLNLNPAYKNFLVHFTGGYPFYLKIISDSLLNRGGLTQNSELKLNGENLTGIIEDLLFDYSGILNQKFSNYIKKFLDSPNSQDYISILYLIANGHNKLKDICHILRKSKKELTLRITQLVELDAIIRSGNFLKINDRIFSFWLKFVYQEKIHSLTFDAKNQKELFRDKIDNLIQEFITSAKKPIRERMSEIMHLFEDDTIQIEKKKLKLTQFREIKTLEFNTGNLKHGLIGRASGVIWIMGFKHDCLTEEDITSFSKECKKYRHKLQKKIIITLDEVEDNARLRALEEKIWTWDINNINQILDLFSKPRVITSEINFPVNSNK
ncbi:MAG: hypothetical protein ABIH18_05900 [Candidatus Omnitrophota bacterium]